MRRMQPRDAQIKLNQPMALNVHTRSQQIYSLLSAGIARHKLSAFYFLSIYICLYFLLLLQKWSMGYDRMRWEIYE